MRLDALPLQPDILLPCPSRGGAVSGPATSKEATARALLPRPLHCLWLWFETCLKHFLMPSHTCEQTCEPCSGLLAVGTSLPCREPQLSWLGQRGLGSQGTSLRGASIVMNLAQLGLAGTSKRAGRLHLSQAAPEGPSPCCRCRCCCLLPPARHWATGPLPLAISTLHSHPLPRSLLLARPAGPGRCCWRR
jgi:hypothetical protein